MPATAEERNRILGDIRNESIDLGEDDWDRRFVGSGSMVTQSSLNQPPPLSHDRTQLTIVLPEPSQWLKQKLQLPFIVGPASSEHLLRCLDASRTKSVKCTS